MVPAPMPTMPSSGPASATPLLGKSWRAASPLAPAPALLAFPPVALMGFFVPLAPVMGLPLWRRLTTPSCPRRRGDGVVANGDLENGRRHVHGFDDAPGTVPGRPEETRRAMKLVAQNNHVIAEGAGACAVAAALTGKCGRGKVVAVVSGGNIDLSRFSELISIP